MTRPSRKADAAVDSPATIKVRQLSDDRATSGRKLPPKVHRWLGPQRVAQIGLRPSVERAEAENASARNYPGVSVQLDYRPCYDSAISTLETIRLLSPFVLFCPLMALAMGRRIPRSPDKDAKPSQRP